MITKYKSDNGQSKEITHNISKSVEICNAKSLWKLEIDRRRERVKTETNKKQELVEHLFKKLLFSDL